MLFKALELPNTVSSTVWDDCGRGRLYANKHNNCYKVEAHITGMSRTTTLIPSQTTHISSREKFTINFSSASLYCESDDQNLSRLAAFIRTSLHSAVTSPRVHLFGIVPYFKSHAIEIRFWWHVYIVVFLKKKTCWNVQPICFGQLTMVLVLQIMAFVRWMVIAHCVVVSSISLSSLELRHIAVVIA